MNVLPIEKLNAPAEYLAMKVRAGEAAFREVG